MDIDQLAEAVVNEWVELPGDVQDAILTIAGDFGDAVNRLEVAVQGLG